MNSCIVLSVICPVYNEAKYIDVCLQSILNQNYPKENLEVLFVDGMSLDETRNIIQSYIKKYSFIKLIDNPQRIVPIAMNLGIKSSVGKIIMRLDAHALYPPNYFLVLVNALNRFEADNIGAPCRTDVLNKTPRTLAIREVLSNRFGVGNSVFRLGVNKVMEVDTVPFGCWNRNVFDRYGYYDIRLIRNQDIELNKRIIRGGGHIYIVPDTYCTYLARETYKGICSNNFLNGKWNILTIFYTGRFSSLSVRHFIPLLFVLSLLIPVLMSILYFPIIYFTLLSLFLYLTTIACICLFLSMSKRLNFFYLLLSFVTLHLSYGWGSLIGMLILLIKKV